MGVVPFFLVQNIYTQKGKLAANLKYLKFSTTKKGWI